MSDYSVTFLACNCMFTVTEDDAEMWCVLSYESDEAALRNDFEEYDYHSEADARREWDLDRAENSEDTWFTTTMSMTDADGYRHEKLVDVVQHVYHIVGE